MFDSKQTLTERIADTVDLLIDFATLGEYGLEPPARSAPSCQSRPRSRSAKPSCRRGDVDRGLAARH